MKPHLPDRPSWRCRQCDLPWPCDPARHNLAQTLTRTPRMIYLAVQLGVAAADMPDVPPLYMTQFPIANERFLGRAGRRT